MALSENPTLEEIVDEVERLNNLIVSRGGAQTITPSTSNKTLNKGYYKGNITIKGDSNLVASNIVSGKSIFGVSGSATVNSLGGKKWASGTTTTYDSTLGDSGYQVHVAGLSFSPKTICLTVEGTTSPITVCSVINGETQYRYGSSTYNVTQYSTTVAETVAKSFISKNAFKLSCSPHLNKKVYWVAYE